MVTQPTVPGAVRNLQRVSFWPVLLTLVEGVFALSAFLHALAVMVRHQRRQLAVLGALGFRRGQLSATVSWYVAALLVPSLVVVSGRWGGACSRPTSVCHPSRSCPSPPSSRSSWQPSPS